MATSQTRHGLTLIFIINIIKQIYGFGVFELGLDSLTNNYGLSSDSKCCRGLRTANGPCSSSCRTFFTVCLKEYQTKISVDSPCTFGALRTPVLGDNSFQVPARIRNSSFVNPITLPFNISWPGTFTLILTAWHDSTPTGQPYRDSPRVVVIRMGVQRFVKASDTWTQASYRDTKTGILLKYSYRVRCRESYYGPSCNHSCTPRDDLHGHYRCSENGSKVCLDQWTGKYCNKPVCLSGCHKDHGFCLFPNECRCRDGWQSAMCDQCVRYPGCKHGTCSLPFQCECLSGWGGRYCDQDLNYCTHHSPCQNGATCKNSGAGSFSCLCRPGYYGDKCQHRRLRDIDDCKPDPCLNGGSCKDIGRTYQCMCRAPWHGRHCESNVTTCAGLPCRQGGTCLAVFKNATEGPSQGAQGALQAGARTEGYKCQCLSGYTGQDCEMEKDECSEDPCKNGGSCIDEFDGYRCVCKQGFDGKNCETNINDCAPENPCQNGGVCKDRIGDFLCECPAGWVGPMCDENVNDCLAQPCANNGTCQDLTNGFHCTCKEGFSGTDCSVNVDDCQENPCHNEGVCVDLVNDYYCQCKRGFTGRDCKILGDVTAVEKIQDGKDKEGLTLQHVIVIVCAGVGLPIILILLVVLILLLKRRRTDRKRNQVISNDMNKSENNQTNADSNKSLNNDKWKTDTTLNIIPPSACVKINNKITQQSLTNCDKNYLEKDINTVDGQLHKSGGKLKFSDKRKRSNVSIEPQKDNEMESLDSAYPSQLQVIEPDISSSSWPSDVICDVTDVHCDVIGRAKHPPDPETVNLHRHSCRSNVSDSAASDEDNGVDSAVTQHCVDIHSFHNPRVRDQGYFQATEV